MKINASEIRVGMLLEYKNDLWQVLKTQHVKPGKGGAFAQLEMKALKDGTKLNERFRSDDKLEKAHVEPRKMQYLYPDGEQFVFMDLETYEQISLNSNQIEQNVKDFLIENVATTIVFDKTEPEKDFTMKL